MYDVEPKTKTWADANELPMPVPDADEGYGVDPTTAPDTVGSDPTKSQVKRIEAQREEKVEEAPVKPSITCLYCGATYAPERETCPDCNTANGS